MNEEQRDMLIDKLADVSEFEVYSYDFYKGFSFKGYCNMSDKELMEYAQIYELDKEDWFKDIEMAYQLSKAIDEVAE